MTNATKPRILIVGAGSIGTILGYNLTLANADVTYLVRPRHIERLSRPQTLFCYEDNSLKQYEGYSVITDHAAIADGRFDYILLTLDGASLQSEDGVKLVEAIGKAMDGTDTRLIQGSNFVDNRRWIKETAGLGGDRFTNAYFAIFAYSPSAVTLPLHGDTDAALLAKADLAYSDKMDAGLFLADSVPDLANDFAGVYNASGVSKAVVVPATEFAMYATAMFTLFAGFELLDWPNPSDIDPAGETWRLAVAAMKEIQLLSIFGEAGRQAAEELTDAGALGQQVDMEKQMRPLDLQAFNRFHHGGKVNKQDRAILADYLAAGHAEGKEMAALTELIRRVEDKAPSRG